MKIEFTKEQYRALVEAVALAHSVSDELRGLEEIVEGEDERSEARHRDMNGLEDYVIQHAPLFDSLDLVENDGGMLSLNQEALGDLMEEVIMPYNQEVFWQELMERLVERDLEKLDGEIDTPELVEHQLRKDYQEEFEENGLDRIRFDKE